MGFTIATRLLKAACNVSVYNRTRSKAEPLEKHGAHIVDTPAELADRDIVFSMVTGPKYLHSIVCPDQGVLSGSAVPKLHIDCSSVSEEGSQQVRDTLRSRGCDMLSPPVSGNAKVIEAGGLTVVASGHGDASESIVFAGPGRLRQLSVAKVRSK